VTNGEFFHSGLACLKGMNPQSPGPTSASFFTVQVMPPRGVGAPRSNALSVLNRKPSETRCSIGARPFA
jgi:hypothetical protein